MKINKAYLITEEEHSVNGIIFKDSTDDQFPYIESAINVLDENFNWWKENWSTLEQLIAKYLKEVEIDINNIFVSSRFTIFHGVDKNVEDVVWTGPAIVYTIENISTENLEKVKDSFGGMYKGHKIFVVENQLIILIG